MPCNYQVWSLSANNYEFKALYIEPPTASTVGDSYIVIREEKSKEYYVRLGLNHQLLFYCDFQHDNKWTNISLSLAQQNHLFPQVYRGTIPKKTIALFDSGLSGVLYYAFADQKQFSIKSQS